ncbi:hypothetical protein [Brevibacillus sp. SYSU BS000544]
MSAAVEEQIRRMESELKRLQSELDKIRRQSNEFEYVDTDVFLTEVYNG